MTNPITLAGAALLALTPLALSQHTAPSRARLADRAVAKGDVVDVAVAAGSFNTLVAAVKAAGLVDALKGDGPFTIFAPSDAAFAKLPKGTLEMLLAPENKAKLTNILTYHVVPGRFDAKHVVGSRALTTLSGISLEVTSNDSGVFVGGAQIVKTDISASNGIIHVLDSVALPPELPNIVGLAQQAGGFSTLLAAAEAAGLVGALSGPGPLTVFAPTDEAFAQLPKGTVASLLEPANKARLVAILKLHVVPGRVDARTAITAGQAASLMGENLQFGIDSGRMQVNGANVIASDLAASNGVVHVIDTVLLPR